MAIALIVKALISAIMLFLAFHIGRCSAARDVYRFRIEASNKMPDDIIMWVNRWDNKRKNNT